MKAKQNFPAKVINAIDSAKAEGYKEGYNVGYADAMAQQQIAHSQTHDTKAKLDRQTRVMLCALAAVLDDGLNEEGLHIDVRID